MRQRLRDSAARNRRAAIRHAGRRRRQSARFERARGKIVAPPGIEVTHGNPRRRIRCAGLSGRAGLVVLTTDAGATFTRVDLAEPLDIASVSATDARNATVTTANGRRFRTDDGGRTWRPF